MLRPAARRESPAALDGRGIPPGRVGPVDLRDRLLQNYYIGTALPAGLADTLCLMTYSKGGAVRTSDLNLGSRDKISWVTATAFGIFHVLAVVALFYTTWQAVVVALALLNISPAATVTVPPSRPIVSKLKAPV